MIPPVLFCESFSIGIKQKIYQIDLSGLVFLISFEGESGAEVNKDYAVKDLKKSFKYSCDERIFFIEVNEIVGRVGLVATAQFFVIPRASASSSKTYVISH